LAQQFAKGKAVAKKGRLGQFAKGFVESLHVLGAYYK
jgi:hypothetical protein